MSEELLRAAQEGLRVRVPETVEDAASLRAEVQAADAALGVLLRSAAGERSARRRLSDDGVSDE